MGIAFGIIYYVFIVAFMVAYTVCFIIGLIRAIKVNKSMKQKCESANGKVIEIIKEKKRVYVKVEYTSPGNRIKFVDFFEFTEKEFADQYYVDQEVKIYYPEVENQKKVTCFPTYLEGVKIKVQSGPIVTDAMFMGVGIFMTCWLTYIIATIGSINIGSIIATDVASASGCGSYGTMIIFLLPLFMYVMTIPYIIERFTMAPKEQNQSYLKLCGAKSMAEVKTFKFSRNKDAKGNKESMMEIEFYNNKGEKIKANLNSFMYSETQEQYINILYDIKNPKNVVYMRK